MDPISFIPLYMERVWGGRELERVYRRQLPPGGAPIGESWELVDREKEQSIVEGGPLAGRTLHQLWSEQRDEIFGSGYGGYPERFPILIKILDARDDLSIQVHPPAAIAPALGGEPKTEMWYVADCDPGASLHVGLRRGVDRSRLESSIRDGSVASCVHRIRPRPGQSIFIPSGRLHAIGAGLLIHEIQQNSDSTFRVFDWNRPGIDGKPRELHVEASLASIDFDDFEPAMSDPSDPVLADCPHFHVERHDSLTGERIGNAGCSRFAILSILTGSLDSPDGRRFKAGDCVLLPRECGQLTASQAARVLRITLP
ncbi:MAG TPA: type I phosphomannose isomerase catalytic subunit [Luteolibacter sp.]|nr:type I phosphomannose isomerase catalytic subunit [Luteolibacter sp.]